MKRSFLITTFTSVFMLILNLGTGIITARVLGPEGKGILRTLIVWPTLFSQIAILGANEAYIYLKNTDIPRKELESSVFFTVITSSFIFGFVTLIVIYLVAHGKYAYTMLIPLLSMLYLPVANLVQTALSIMQEELNFIKYNLLRLSLPAIYLVLLLSDLRHLTPQRCFFYLILSNAALLLLSYNTFQNISFFNVKRSIIRKILNFGIKTQLTNIMSSFSQQVDQAILSVIAPSSALGIYSVAASIGKIGFLAPNAAQIVLYPLFSKGKVTGWKKYFLYLSLLNATLFGALIVTIKPLVLLLFGKPFAPSAGLSLILFLAAFPISLINVAVAHFKAKGKPLVTTKAQFIILAGILIFAPIGYNVLNLKGIALAIITSYLLGALYYLYVFRNREET